MKSQSTSGGNIGGSSILVIFVLLCVTTFAALSLVSALAGHRLALQMIESSTAMYKADARAEELLAQVSQIVRENTNIESRLGEIGVEYSDNIISFDVPINDGLVLEVRLLRTNQGLQINQWRTRAYYDPQLYEQGTPIWSGF